MDGPCELHDRYRFFRDKAKAEYLQFIPVVERISGRGFQEGREAAGRSSLRIFRPTCGEGVALEHNGDVYSCDRFVGRISCWVTSRKPP